MAELRDTLGKVVSHLDGKLAVSHVATSEPEPDRIPELHGVERHARYWTDAAKQCDDREEALMALHQAVCGWKNAAYAAWDKLNAWKKVAKQNEEVAADAIRQMDSSRSSTATITDQERLALVERLQRAASNLFDADMLTDCETVREAARQLLCVPSATGHSWNDAIEAAAQVAINNSASGGQAIAANILTLRRADGGDDHAS